MRKKPEIHLVVLCILIATATLAAHAQQLEKTRHRVPQTEVAGRRIELSSLKGAVLFVPPGAENLDRLPLIVHFHGAPWLVEYHIAKELARSALITVQLGAGSSVYGRPFGNTQLFRAITDEARTALKMKRDWTSITLTGFSAGYGAIRAILRHGDDLRRVDNVMLLDGIHASYSPEGVPPAVKSDDLDSFVSFARLAVAGKKSFVITHSAIVPGAYASTTECANFLIESLGLQRRMSPLETSTGMYQTSVVDAQGFHVRGYSGSTAPDHVDHIHSMPVWFGLLKI